MISYHKIPKISPRTYIFQRPLLRGLFLEGLILGGAYVWREICVSRSIGLAYSWKKFTVFALFYFVFEGNFQVWAPVRAYIQRGDLTEVFFALQVWGAYIWRSLFSEFNRIWSSNIVHNFNTVAEFSPIRIFFCWPSLFVSLRGYCLLRTVT